MVRDVRVLGGNAVVGRAVHVLVDVDAQHLAEQGVGRLRVALRVVGVAAVAHADVEVAVRAELQLPAVVVGVRLGDRQEDGFAERVGAVTVERRHVVPRHDGLSRTVGVVHEEETVGRVGRVKRGREQTLLAAADDLRGDVEKRRRQDLGAVPDDDLPPLQRHEDAPVAGVGDRGDARQPGRQLHELERRHDRGLLSGDGRGGSVARARREHRARRREGEEKSGCPFHEAPFYGIGLAFYDGSRVARRANRKCSRSRTRVPEGGQIRPLTARPSPAEPSG